MVTTKTVFRMFALVALVALLPASVRAAEPTALRVVVVETTDADAYVKEIEKGKALMKRMELPGQIRVWKARFAGDRTGTVVVAIEYANLTELAKAEDQMTADKDYMAWLKGLDKVRKVISDSIYYELKP